MPPYERQFFIFYISINKDFFLVTSKIGVLIKYDSAALSTQSVLISVPHYMPGVFMWVYISNILCVYKLRLSEQILDIWATKNRTEESLSLGPATEHLLTHPWRSWRQWWGRDIFRDQERPKNSSSVTPDAPAAEEPEGAEPHGTVLTAVSPSLFWRSHG